MTSNHKQPATLRLEAPFDSGEVINVGPIESLPLLAQQHGLTKLQVAVAEHVFIRHLSYRQAALVLGESAQAVRAAAVALAGKLGFAGPNVVMTDAFDSVAILRGVPVERQGQVAEALGTILAGPQRAGDDLVWLCMQVPAELHEGLLERIEQTVQRWEHSRQGGQANNASERDA